VYLSKERFNGGRNFTNKIWNAARFAFMSLEGFKEGETSLNIADDKLSNINRWIIAELNQLIGEIDRALSKFRFNDACLALQRFIWGEFCDWYLELQKPVFYGSRGEEEKVFTQKVIFYVMDKMLRLLHPIMPFITEEIWQQLKNYTTEQMSETIMQAEWPVGDTQSVKVSIDTLKEIISAIRDMRARFQISPKEQLKIVCKSLNKNKADAFVESFKTDIQHIAKVSDLVVADDFVKEKGMLLLSVSSAIHDFEAYVCLGDFVDEGKEKEKLENELARLEEFLVGVQKKLSNDNFVARAPKEILEKEQGKKKDLLIKIENTKTALAEL